MSDGMDPTWADIHGRHPAGMSEPEPLSADQKRRDAITNDQRWQQGYAAGRAAARRSIESLPAWPTMDELRQMDARTFWRVRDDARQSAITEAPAVSHEVPPITEQANSGGGSTEASARVATLEAALLAAEAVLRREGGRTKTIYGGSDFAPVDYKVLIGSPTTLIEAADAVRSVLTSGEAPVAVEET